MTKSPEPDWTSLRILIVDKDEAFRLSLRALLRRYRIGDVLSADSPVKALEMLHKTPANLILLATRPGDASAAAFAKTLRDPTQSPTPEVPVLAVISPKDRDMLSALPDMGIDGAVPKPFNDAAMIKKLSETLLGANGLAARRKAAAQAKGGTTGAVPTGKSGRGAVLTPIADKAAGGPSVRIDTKAGAKKGEVGIETPPPPQTQDQAIEVAESIEKHKKDKHSADAWAAELAAKGKTKRALPPGIDMSKIIKEHTLWLTSGGKKGKQANLSGQDLSCVDISDAMLHSAILTGVDFSDANLAGADLNGSDMRRVVLSGANLKDADLGVARLRHANFGLTTLENTNLRGADLAGATFRNAKIGDNVQMHGAVFLETDLTDVDMAKVEGLTQAQANKGRANLSTKLPSGLQRVIPKKPLTL